MDVFAAIAEPTRRKIVEMLASHGSMPASSIAKRFDSTLPAISQHLKILHEAKIIRVKKMAQQRIYFLNPEAFNTLETWINDISANLDNLDQYLKTNESWQKQNHDH